MTKKRSRPRRRGTKAARSRYDPTPWPGLVGAPFVLLLNLVVITAEDNAKTDGPIPTDAIQTVQALIRQRYDFPDLALDEGQGVGLSMIGQFFHVDDYRELRMDQLHRSQILATLQGEKEEPVLDLEDGDLRQSNLSDPQSLAEGHERALGLWYKQRLLAFYFVGERAQIGRLTQEPPGDELLQNILAVLEQALDPGRVGPDLDHDPSRGPIAEQLAKRTTRRGDRVLLEDLALLVQHAVAAPAISKIHSHDQPRSIPGILLHGRPPPWAS